MNEQIKFTTRTSRKIKLLAVIDMQNDFIDGSLGSEAAQAIVLHVIDKIKNGGYDGILVTRDTHFDNYLNTQEGQVLPIEHCIAFTPGWNLNEEVDKAIRYFATGRPDTHPVGFIEKRSFGSLQLPSVIENVIISCNFGEDPIISEIDVVGLCTDICVVSNVMILKAAYPEAKITVYKNCCAGTSQEAHEAALKTMESCQIQII